MLLTLTDTVLFLLLKRFHVLQNPRENIASQVGGLVLVLNMVLIYLLWSGDKTTPGIICGILLIAFLGLYDDKYGCKAPAKLAVQFIAAVLLLYHLNLTLPYLLTGLVVIVCVSNIMNLSDGIDGLCAVICMTLVLFFVLIDVVDWTRLYNISIISGLSVFLLFNLVPKRRIILGDTGSLMLGFFIGFQVISRHSGEDTSSRLVALMLLLAYPISDTFVAVIRRMMDGRNILQGDRLHIHHLMSERFSSQRKALVTLATLQTLLFIAALVVMRYEAVIQGVTFFIIVLSVVTYYGIKTHLQQEAYVTRQALIEVARVKQRSDESHVTRDR